MPIPLRKEYPVLVNGGLVLTGYSTALVPVKLMDDDTILWHLEIAKHDSQIKVSELSSLKGNWYKVENFDDLRSRKALVGWCAESITLLGTDQLGTVWWSNAKAKKTSWRGNEANLQFIATSTAPLQLGGQVGLTFERRPNMLRYDAAKNYLKCLNSSFTEHMVLYDCSASRAWLVPLICIFHEMVLAYWRGLPDAYRAPSMPFAAPMSDGAEAAYAALRDCGGHVVDQSKEDRVTIRELILGFSANLFSTSLQPPGRSEIYGYEFMDIMKDSYATELKRRTITMPGVPWISLLEHFTCLFCSDLGDAIRGSNGDRPDLSCNQLPKRNDWLAVSMHSIVRLNRRYGGDIRADALQLSSQHYWLMQGLPFQQCDHADGTKGSCWDSSTILQDSQSRVPPPQTEPSTQHTCRNGAVAFGCYRRSQGLLRQISISRQNVEQSVQRASQNSTALTLRLSAKRQLDLAFTTSPDSVQPL